MDEYRLPSGLWIYLTVQLSTLDLNGGEHHPELVPWIRADIKIMRGYRKLRDAFKKLRDL